MIGLVLLIALAVTVPSKSRAQDRDAQATQAGNTSPAAAAPESDSPASVLSPDEWSRVDAAVERGLAFLANQQQPDGSFPTLEYGQPGVTSLCVLAFMAHGHNPGEGQYGQRLNRAVDFILSCQKDNGLVTLFGPEGERITSDVPSPIGEPAAYNHAISSLALSEAYGMRQSADSAALQKAISKAVAATLEMQRWPKDLPDDRGGWRYITDDGLHDSDLSVTGWQLMFLRSARNAGFDVPKESIDDAVKYIRRTFNTRLGRFAYTTGEDSHGSRGMAGAGILALAHAGFHDSPEAQRSGQWLLRNTFDDYNRNSGEQVTRMDRYHYSLFNSTQAMYQLGGSYWKQFFPRTVTALLAHQQSDGSWEPDRFLRDRQFGNSYSSALVLLSLGAPNQLLPIFQR